MLYKIFTHIGGGDTPLRPGSSSKTGFDTGAYRGVQGRTGAYRGVQGRTGAYRGVQGRTGAYRGVQGQIA